MRTATEDSLRILFSTGEVSGDIAAAALAAALRRACPGADLVGVGGPRLAHAGMRLLFNTNHLGSVGITEPLNAVPGSLKALRRIRRSVRESPPSAAILVGHDVFNMVLARWLRKKGVLTLAYFPPQVWLWRAVARRIGSLYDHVLTSFREEHEVYARAGAKVHFVGHFLLDEVGAVSPAARDAARAALGIPPGGRVIGVFPGSRSHEIRSIGPVLLDAAMRLHARRPELRFVLPVADPCNETDVRRLLDSRARPLPVLLTRDGRGSLAACDLAMLCSGTVTLEAALQKIAILLIVVDNQDDTAFGGLL